MYPLLLVLVTLMCPIAAADELPSIPFNDKKYGEATDKAQQAFLAQSGINSSIKQIKDYGAAKGNRYLIELGIDKQAAVVIFAYKVYRDKSLTLPITKTIRTTIRLNSIQFNINF
jgi:hypothetical protein